MHDSLALAAAFAPECLKCTKYFVDVECEGEYTAGHTMVEMKSRKNKDHIPNVEVALEIDVPAFRKWLGKEYRKLQRNKQNMEQRIVTKPSFYTNIMLLSIPIILQQFLRVSVDLCDSIMLGRIDQVQMAAVSQAQQIFFVFYTVCNGFAVGCSVLIAQYWGLQRKEEIKTLFAIGSKIIAVFAIIISAIGPDPPGSG